MCVNDGLCFQYTALRNHRSVPQQPTSYATGQTVCTFISESLKEMVMLRLLDSVDVLHWCGCIVVLDVIWQCDHFCHYTYMQPCVSRFYLYTVTHTVVFKVLNVVYTYIPMHH